MMKGVEHIAILGAAESGVGAAMLAKARGYVPFVSDAKKIHASYKKTLTQLNIPFEEGGHTPEKLYKADVVIKSPGIPDQVPVVRALKDQGKPIISEIEFAARHSQATVVAVTGSNGKTTTTALTYHILKNAGLDVGIAGNIGFSFARQLAAQDRAYFVLEVSSFQLDGCYDFKPHIGILTNITPDHLDRYNYNLDLYVQSKFRLGQAQDENDHFIYCLDDPITTENIERFALRARKHTLSLSPQQTGGFLNEQGTATIHLNGNTMSIDELALQGKHNVYNSLAAGLASRILNIRKEVIRESLSDFEGLEHRLEPVLNIHSIEFINDSKATNINSTYYALESMKKPTIWIAGGEDKGNDYSQLHELVKDKVKAIVCLGLDNTRIIEEFGEMVDIILETKSMEEAVRSAYMLGRKGEVVLLSPACASFDLFENYEERGKQFKEQVRRL
jgi:UDP-N-acetylmuramoylalanine--D-glutamate ligase